MDTLFSVKQAAFILKIHPLTVRRYIKEGKLKAVKVGGNVRIKESQLQDLNRDVKPRQETDTIAPKIKLRPAKIFTVDDPLLRLKGRGASLHLST